VTDLTTYILVRELVSLDGTPVDALDVPAGAEGWLVLAATSEPYGALQIDNGDTGLVSNPPDWSIPALDADGERVYLDVNDTSGALVVRLASGASSVLAVDGPPPAGVKARLADGTEVAVPNYLKGALFPKS
jgi:hypothetical protein